jgi:hypothetical protein
VPEDEATPARRPDTVSDEHGEAELDAMGSDVGAGVDTDGDGHPDTLLTGDGADLLVHTDLDADGLADRLLRIGPDGSVHVGPETGPGSDRPDDDAGFAGPTPGSAPSTWPLTWLAMLGWAGPEP